MWMLEQLETHLLIGSTLVEGSTLTEDEAARVLAGKTVLGHPLREIRELYSYRASVAWLIEAVSRVPFVSVDLIVEFHTRLFSGTPARQGFKTHDNFTYRTDGTKHAYASPPQVPERMRAFLDAFNNNPSARGAVPAAAAALYYAFQDTHPFDDGNGRIGRVLVAYWAHWHHSLAFRFYASDRLAHLAALESANVGDFDLLREFFEMRMTP